MSSLENVLVDTANFLWSYILYLLVGGGAFLLFFSRFKPFRYLKHAVDILRGRYDDPDQPGDITHFQALVSALSATVGVGNISGVAVSITIGGPGAIFWMWVTAFFGIATKFFSCTLAVMYRGKDSLGQLQGGPMYVIEQAMSPRFRPLAYVFAIAGAIGCLPLLNPNQLVQAVRDILFVPNGWVGEDHFWFDFTAGIILAGLSATVILGGITRIAEVASRVVPAMVVVYMLCALWIILANWEQVPFYVALIFSDAFTGDAVVGGAVGTVIATGIRRAAFSNEAGLGTAPLAHGAAKTGEPIREGFVAMTGPVIDTMVVCTCTAMVILMTGVWQTTSDNGVTLTANAFTSAMPGFGSYVLLLCVAGFSVTSLFTYSYYGAKCLAFLVGAEHQQKYNYFYVAFIVVASVSSIDAVISFADGFFAIMAIPTMVSTLVLAPRVMRALRDYEKRYPDLGARP